MNFSGADFARIQWISLSGAEQRDTHVEGAEPDKIMTIAHAQHGRRGQISSRALPRLSEVRRTPSSTIPTGGRFGRCWFPPLLWLPLR